MSLTMPVWADDLMEIYSQALQSDPVYQAAKSTRLSNREALPQSVAGLLPAISGTTNTNTNVQETLNLPQGSSTPTGTQRFNSNGYTLSLTQTVFNFATLMQVREASATAKEADATFGAAAQDLLVRVAQDYFNVLQAQDVLRATEAQKASSARQLDQEQERFKVGLDPITSVYDAKAQYDGVVALEIADQNSLRNSQEALRQLTGQYYASIEGLKIELPLITPQPADVEQWADVAEKENLTLLAARFATVAARENVKVNFAGHLPSLSAVGSYTRSNTQQYGTPNTNTRAAGLQLNLPIFEGGLVTSQTRQAEDNYATASANMEDTYRQTIVTVHQQYNNIISGMGQIKADRQAIVSAQASLDSTEESYKVGTRTIVDVLLAQQRLYQTQRTYAQDEYAYLISTILLKQAAGTLTVADLQAINVWLHTPKTKPSAVSRG